MIGAPRNAVSIVAHALQQAGIIHDNRGRIKRWKKCRANVTGSSRPSGIGC